MRDPSTISALNSELEHNPRMQVQAVQERKYYEDQSGIVSGQFLGLALFVAIVIGIGAVFGAMNTTSAPGLGEIRHDSGRPRPDAPQRRDHPSPSSVDCEHMPVEFPSIGRAAGSCNEIAFDHVLEAVGHALFLHGGTARRRLSTRRAAPQQAPSRSEGTEPRTLPWS
jgi:hypothetical protein